MPGTNCCPYGAHSLIGQMSRYVNKNDLSSCFCKSSFRFERCGESPVVRLNGTIPGHTFEKIKEFIDTK